MMAATENNSHPHLNRSLSPYGGNNFHHLHPFPAKSPPPSPPPPPSSAKISAPLLHQPQHPPQPQLPTYSHSQVELQQHHSAPSSLMVRRGRGYFSSVGAANGGDDLSSESTEYSDSGAAPENSLPLNRHHRNASSSSSHHHQPALIATNNFHLNSAMGGGSGSTTPTTSSLVFLSPSSSSPSSSPHNLYSSSHHNASPSGAAAAALAALAPAVTTSTLPSLLVWSSNHGNRNAAAAVGANRTAVDWGRVRQSLNGSVGQLLTEVAGSGGRSSYSSSYSTASPQPATSDGLDVFDGGSESAGNLAEAGGSLWPSAQDIPILIGAIAGGAVLLIVVILLLVIWNCCDRDDVGGGGGRRRDKNNFNNGSSDRSNRSSLSGGSCGSNSNSLNGGGVLSGGGGVYGKRHSSNLYINNPNSLEVERCSGGSADSTNGVVMMGSSTTGSSTAAAIHHQLQHHQAHYPQAHYHFTNYDYGPGPTGSGQQSGVAQLVIGNARVLAGATALVTTPPEGSANSGNNIPRSVSVPLSRSNSRKDSNAPIEAGVQHQQQQQPVRSQLSQALTRNIATYYETQRQKNAKSQAGTKSTVVEVVGSTASADHHHHKNHQQQSSSSAGSKAAALSSAIILNDLSLNLDMLDEGTGGNVIVNHNGGSGGGQWVMLQTGATTITANAAQGEVDLEAYREGQADFYRTRSLPWSQSSRGKSVPLAGTPGASDHHHHHHQQHQNQQVSVGGAGSSTTMGRVNFTKKRRNRMRNDSAAAIAINRSGLLGGSLDWDFQGVGRGGESTDGTQPSPASSSGKQVSRSGSSVAAATLPATALPLVQPSCTAATASPAVPSAVATAAAAPTDTGSPDSAEFLTPDAIVVYNERTAL